MCFLSFKNILFYKNFECKNKQIKMKIKLLMLISVLLLISANCFSQEEVKFAKGNYNDILALAKSENKIIMADFFTDWCVWCVELDKKVYHNSEAAAYMNEHQINWKTDAEKGEGIELAKKFNVNGYPSIIFIDANGNEIDRIVGYFPPKTFLKLVKDINESNNLTPELQEKYNANPNGLEENYLLAKKYSDAGDMESAEKYLTFVINHADKSSEMYTECKLKYEAAKGNITEVQDYIKSNPDGKFLKDACLSLAELQYTKENNFDAAEKTYLTLIEKYPSDEDVSFAYAMFLRGKIFKMTSDSTVNIQDRISYAEKIFSDNTTYLGNSVNEAAICARLANLYLKAGDKNKALECINRALAIFDNKTYRELKDKIVKSN